MPDTVEQMLLTQYEDDCLDNNDDEDSEDEANMKTVE